MIKLIHGEAIDEMSKIPDKSIDAVICDPPYGITKCKWDSVIEFDLMWNQLNRITKDNAAIVLFGTQPFTSALIMSNPKMFKYCWVWDKVRGVGFQCAKYRPMMRTEDIIVFSNKKGALKTYNKQMIKRDKVKKSKCYSLSDSNPLSTLDNKLRVYTHKNPVNLIQFSNASQKGKVHPTQKPVNLMEYLIKTYTNQGDTILDFTAGSFSTGVACVNLERDFIGIELDKNYFDIGTNRIKDRIKCLDLNIDPIIKVIE